jgi:hypothetical protein
MEKIDKDKFIVIIRKMIEDKKVIHEYIRSGKDLSELKTKYEITFSSPL